MKTDTIAAIVGATIITLPILFGIFVDNIFMKIVAIVFLIFVWIVLFMDMEKDNKRRKTLK